MAKFIFHGGCHGCTQQEINGTEFCAGCCFFNADWSKPNLNNEPPSAADVERQRIMRKLRMPNAEHEGQA